MRQAEFDVRVSLRRLLRRIPPPRIPREVGREPTALTFASGAPVKFPPDYLRLTGKYGSGEFVEEGDLGMLVSAHNPRARAYRRFLDTKHRTARLMKQQEGEYRDYEIFPASPGLLQWGWAEGRKGYFWLTEGSPPRWPTVVMWDHRFAGRFDLPVVVFLERLLCGDLDCRFIGDEREVIRLNPSRISFVSRSMVAE
jgi:hypothetical protein